jgi:hypothetical protein
MLLSYETRVWVPTRPKSSQGRGRFAEYEESIRAATRPKFAVPLTCPVEITIVFADWEKRPDVGNIEKVIVDALEGVAIVNDRQVRKVSAAVVDQTMRQMMGENHRTFQQLLKGECFMIRIMADPPVPSIIDEVPSS